MWAGIRRRARTLPLAGDLPAKSPGRALRSMYTYLLHLSVYGEVPPPIGPRSWNFWKGRRVCSLSTAQFVRIRAPTTSGEILTNAEFGDTHDDLLNGNVVAASWNLPHTHLQIGVRVPRSSHGYELVVLAQCNPPGFVYEVLRTVQGDLGGVHVRCLCWPARVSQFSYPFLYYDMVSSRKLFLLNLPFVYPFCSLTSKELDLVWWATKLLQQISRKVTLCHSLIISNMLAKLCHSSQKMSWSCGFSCTWYGFWCEDAIFVVVTAWSIGVLRLWSYWLDFCQTHSFSWQHFPSGMLTYLAVESLVHLGHNMCNVNKSMYVAYSLVGLLLRGHEKLISSKIITTS